MGNYTQLAVLGRQMRARRGRNPRPAVHEALPEAGPSYTCPKCGDASVAPSWCDRCQHAMADPGTTVSVRGEEGSVRLQHWGGIVVMLLSFLIAATVLMVCPAPLENGRSLEPVVMAGLSGVVSAGAGLLAVATLLPKLEAKWSALRERRAFVQAADRVVRGTLHVDGRGEARRVWIETTDGPIDVDPKTLQARVDLHLTEGDPVEALGELAPCLRRDGYRSDQGRALTGASLRVRRA